MDITSISAEALGNLIGVTGRRVRQLAAEGKIPKANAAGRYDAPAVVRHLLAEARSSRPEGALEVARARALEVKTSGEELRLAERRRELISVVVADEIIDRLAATVLAELVGLARRVTRDPALCRRIEDEVTAARVRIGEALAKAGGELASGRNDDGGEDETDDD